MVHAVKGWEGKIRLAETESGLKSSASEIQVQSVSITQDTTIDNKFVIGQRNPYGVLEGATEISGSIEKPLEDTEFLNYAGVKSSGKIQTPTTLYLGIFPQGTSGTDMLIVENVRFGTWSTTIAPDEIVNETVDFMGNQVKWVNVNEFIGV